MPGSLDSVMQKISRAEMHGKSLVAELERYFKTNPGEVVRHPNASPDEQIYTIRQRAPVPSIFGLIIGDCLQNLRSSLDYLVRELVLAANCEPTDHEMFPVCAKPKVFKEAIRLRRLEGVAQEAIAEVEALQPYHLGQDWANSTLLVLDQFTNINKHRRVLLTLLRGAESNFLIPDEGTDFIAPGTPMPIFQDNAKIRATPIPGQVQMKAQVLACVTFDEGAARGMEISISINQWMNYLVNGVVPRFARFFE